MTRKTPNKRDDDNNEELERYLTSDSDVEIYEDLTGGDYVGLFEPLEFFKLLYAQNEFVKANKEKPLSVVKSLNKLKYSDKQKWFLLEHLCELINDEIYDDYPNNKDEQLNICRACIEKERDRFAGKFNPQKETEPQSVKDKGFFERKVKPHLLTLPDDSARLKYLYEAKTEFQQNFSKPAIDCDWGGEPSFAEKCELEIQKLRQHAVLEQNPLQARNEATKRNPAFTTARQVLAIHYLLQFVKVRNVDKSEIARFIEFLTGKNYDSIYKKVREPLKIKDSEAKKDLEFVKAYFMKLGLSEIVIMIDKEMT